MAGNRQFGTSGPMSEDEPNANDLRLNESLTHELKAQNEFESSEATDMRKAVLERLEIALQRLVQLVGRQKGLPQQILSAAGGKIFTYGSYQLGVYGPGADIDTLMLAPKHVTREHFFEQMPGLLRKEFKPEEITEMTPVPGISVPIIKLELCGVSIDLIFCSLQLSSIPQTQELNDINLLRGLDDTDLRCVNGTRVTRRILELVPQTKVFRMALRAVKLWAKRRGLYGNIVGFPGGVAYAMMVARTCQLYPRAVASHVLMKFFFLMKKWKWPTPVVLQAKEEAPLGLREWDPNVWPGDKRHLMPVITPAYPRQNAIHTVGPSTKQVLMKEFQRAEDLMSEIYDKSRPWKDLFARHNFFTTAYKHYIVVVTAGKTREAQQAWSGLVESRIKRLIGGIEQSNASSVELVHPFNKGFNRVHECKNDAEIERTIEGGLDQQIKDSPTGTDDVKVQGAAQTDTDGQEVPATNGTTSGEEEGPQKIWTTTFYMGIGLFKGANSLDISGPVTEFKANCREWPNYDVNLHSISIKHVRNYDLPSDVFVAGETKPTKPKKKNATSKAADAAAKKRSFNDTGLDENNDPAKRRQSTNGQSSTPQPNGVANGSGFAG